MKVFVKFFPTLGYFSLCHSRSGQNAFASHINRFETEEQAQRFAISKGCEVVR